MLSPYFRAFQSIWLSSPVYARMVYNDNNRRSQDFLLCQRINVLKQCMKENYFKLRNQILKQTERTCMGSCLSPFIANVFNLKSSPLFPRLWLRYGDNIFAVTKREKVNETLTWLNSQHQKIQFTFEIEENGRIPFLDVMVERYIDRLVFDVYRKPSNTKRYITADSSTHNATKTQFSIPWPWPIGCVIFSCHLKTTRMKRRRSLKLGE
jgi:hypothetical protein